MGSVKLYLNLIVTDRQWSWTLIGISYLIVALFVRLQIFRKLVREAKQIDSNLYSAVKSIYLRNSLSGWILFFLSFLLAIGVWVGWKGSFLETTPLILFGFLLPLLFFLSTILHLMAFAKALLVVLRQRMGVEKEF